MWIVSTPTESFQIFSNVRGPSDVSVRICAECFFYFLDRPILFSGFIVAGTPSCNVAFEKRLPIMRADSDLAVWPIRKSTHGGRS